MFHTVTEPSIDQPLDRPTPTRQTPRTGGSRTAVAGAGATQLGPSSSAAVNATLIGRDDLCPAVARFRVRPDDGVPAFVPGQYFALGLTVGGRLVQRPYSTASPAGTRDELDFLVRLVPNGRFTPRLWAMPVGERLRIGPPKGVFALRQDDERARLFLATGTGLAPFVSMVATILASRDGASGPARVVVVHGVSRVAELAYGDQLRAWAERHPGVAYVPVISRAADPGNAGWTGATGRLDAVIDTVCAEQSLDPHDTVAYLCGNPEMITAARERLGTLGFAADALISEHYWIARSRPVAA